MEVFIGKNIAYIGVGAIAGVVGLCLLDKKVSAGNKAKLVALLTGLGYIVHSL